MNTVAAIAALAVVAQAPTFRSSVDVVTVPVSVTFGNRPADVRPADFELFDNGARQTFELTRLEDAAIDVTLVLDVSSSVEGRALDQMKRDVIAIGDGLRPSDRIRVLGFADNVETIVPFTSGGTPIPIDHLPASGATSLYAAMTAALLVDPAIMRPQLVFVMTDGRDDASFASADTVLALAARSRACLYLARVEPSTPDTRYSGTGAAATTEENTVFGPDQRGIFQGVSAIHRTMGPYAGGPNVAALKGIAARTGGAYYEHSHDSLVELFERALREFRESYLLSYTPSNIDDKGWHDITVRVRNHRYTVRARKGYQR